jgi:hypothetical protein
MSATRPSPGGRTGPPHWALEARGPNPKYVSRYSILSMAHRNSRSPGRKGISALICLPLRRFSFKPSASATPRALLPCSRNSVPGSSCVRLLCVSVVFATPMRLCECERPPANGSHFRVRLQFAVALPPLFGFHSGYFTTTIVRLISSGYLAAMSGRCFDVLLCWFPWRMLYNYRGRSDPFFGGYFATTYVRS